MIRIERELNRTCAACGNTGEVLLLQLGWRGTGGQSRICDQCWFKLGKLAVQVRVQGLEAAEDRS